MKHLFKVVSAETGIPRDKVEEYVRDIWHLKKVFVK